MHVPKLMRLLSLDQLEKMEEELRLFSTWPHPCLCHAKQKLNNILLQKKHNNNWWPNINLIVGYRCKSKTRKYADSTIKKSNDNFTTLSWVNNSCEVPKIYWKIKMIEMDPFWLIVYCRILMSTLDSQTIRIGGFPWKLPNIAWRTTCWKDDSHPWTLHPVISGPSSGSWGDM